MVRLAILWFCAAIVLAQTTAQAPQSTPLSGIAETHQVFDPSSGKFVDTPQPKPTDSATFPVSGTVRDRDTKLPVSGARVILQTGRNAAFADSAIGRPGVKVAISAADGTFSFDGVESGMHSFIVTADEWLQPDSAKFVSIRKPMTVELSLIRPAALSGRLVDTDTHKPITQIEVTAMRVRWDSGALASVGSDSSVVSDKDGDFRFEKLMPGEYILEIVGNDAKETLEVARPNRNAPESPDKEDELTGYRRQRWPANFREGGTFTLLSAADVPLGDIHVTRLPMYRISGEVKPAECSSTSAIKIDLSQQYANGGTERGDDLTVPCGGEYLIRNLSPGEYYLEATVAKGSGAVQQMAEAKVKIADRDVKQDLAPAPALTITGHAELPDGFPKDFQGVALATRDVEGTASGGGIVPLANDGTFYVKPYGALTFQLTVLRLPPPYYAAEVKYAGQVAPHGLITVNPFSMRQMIDMRISAKSAGVTGTVREKDDPAPGATVLLLPWPLREIDGFPMYYETDAGEDGSFAIGQLPPDTYHLLSVDPDTWNTQLQKPGMLAALAANGQEVVVAGGQTGNATLELKHVAGTP